MIFKPFSADSWFRFRPRENPDRVITRFERSRGEFSPIADIAFEKHLNRLLKWNKMEPLWNGRGCR